MDKNIDVLFDMLYEWNVKKVLIFQAIYICICFYGIITIFKAWNGRMAIIVLPKTGEE